MDFTDETLIAPDRESQATRPGRTGARALERGDALGRYVVVERLGAGGMGVVYAAYDPELDRKLALKLLQSDPSGNTDATAGRSRLLREAQAMARLSHPNVIAVHDVGTVDDQVFVAMEFVDGATLTDWLARSRRTWREIVDVFIAAGHGLIAAHAAGIIHRDFKPDNVMVGRDGRVQVLDFGLARPVVSATSPAVRAELAGTASASASSSLDIPLTLTGAVMGTPAYMAPEQHLGQEADARTDQFSFCVALWEAVYGERPFRGDTLAVLAFQVAQGKIKEPDEPGRAPRFVRKILERGLARDPEDRHPDMDALLAALSRDPGRTRRRAFAAAGVLAVAALGGGLFQDARASALAACRDADAVTSAWSSAARSAAQTAFEGTGRAYAGEAWGRASARVDAWIEAWEAGRVDACEATHDAGSQTEAALALRLACLDGQARHLTGLVEAWQAADAEVVLNASQAALDLPDPADCSDVAALERRVAPPDDPDTRRAVDGIRRELEMLRAARSAGAYAAALERAAQAVEDARATGYRPVLAEALLIEGQLLMDVSKPREALGRIAEAIFEAEASGHDEAAADAWLAELTVQAVGASDYDAAERAVPRADAALVRLGDPPRMRARFLNRQGMVVRYREKYAEAVALQRQALELLGSAESARAIEGDIRNNMGTNLKNLHKYEEAEAELLAAIEAWSEALGPDHPKIARALVNLGNVHASLLRHDEAVAHLEKALEIFRGAHGNDHFHVAAALNGLGLMSETLKRPGDAKRYYLEALPILEKTMGPDHMHTSHVLNNLGNVTRTLGEYDASLDHHRRALALKAKLRGPETVDVALSHDNLGDTYLAMGDLETARTEFETSIALLRSLDNGAGYLAYPLTRLGETILEGGDPAGAIVHLEAALQARLDDEDDPEETASTRLALARALHAARRDPSRVRSLAERARDDWSAAPHHDEELAEAERFLARLPAQR